MLYIQNCPPRVDCKIKGTHEMLALDIMNPGRLTYRLVLVNRPQHQTEKSDTNLYSKFAELINICPSLIFSNFNC